MLSSCPTVNVIELTVTSRSRLEGDDEESHVTRMSVVNSTRVCHVMVEGWTDDNVKYGHVRHGGSVGHNHKPADKETCAKSVIDFNRETARYCSMVVGLGGSRDTRRLRTELNRCRQRAFTQARFICNNLMPLLKRSEGFKAESNDLERLYRLFSSNLELLQIHLRTTLMLQHWFPQQSAGEIIVIHTGIVEPVLSHKYSMHDAFDLFSVESGRVDDAPLIVREINELRDMTHDINQRFDIRPWDAEPNTDLNEFDERSISSDMEAGTGNFITIHEPTLRRRRRCLCIVAVVIVLVAITGIVLGITLPLVR